MPARQSLAKRQELASKHASDGLYHARGKRQISLPSYAAMASKGHVDIQVAFFGHPRNTMRTWTCFSS